MRFFTSFRTIILLALATLMVAGCSTSNQAGDSDVTSQDRKTVTVVTPYLANAATKEVIELFTKEAEARNLAVTVVDTAGDMNKLNSAFQDAAAQKTSAIILGTGDPTQISLGLKSAKEANIPVFSIDAGEAEGIVANVTSDNTDLGQQSAQALVDAMGKKGNIVMFTHDPHPGVRARAEGARQVFKDAGITILEEKHVNVPGPVDNARTSMQDIISSRGNEVQGVWGGWDEPALGVTQALEAANTTIPVVGVDGQDFAIEEIEKGGPFVATVKQDWQAIATKVADLVEDMLVNNKQPDQRNYELPGTLITKQ